MMRHTKIYLDFFGYGEQDMIPSEISGGRAVDCHHILGRGKNHDIIENLMALTRREHEAAEGLLKDEFYSVDDLIYLHREFIRIHRPDYRFDIDKLMKLK